jgi:glycosyltransferase involved in cell wall biosynthesis
VKKKAKEFKTILCVARLEEFKGIQYAIQALPWLEESTRLEIVGKGAYKAKLVKLARELGVAHRVGFYQDLRGSKMLERYANADLLVLLSRYEAFALAVLEAKASRTPCIVANTSALKEWVDDKNCFGVDYPISIDKLARLITEVMGKEVGEVKLWDWDEVVRQIETLYTA